MPSPDPGIARLARARPATVRRWLGNTGTTSVFPDYNFFLWKGQLIDSPPRTSWTSDDKTRTPPSVTQRDVVLWDSWDNQPNAIGATALAFVQPIDVLYISDGPAWQHIVWANVQAGDHIQLIAWDNSGTLQDWVTTGPFVVVAPGGHVAVQEVPGSPLLVPLQGQQVQVLWIH